MEWISVEDRLPEGIDNGHPPDSPFHRAFSELVLVRVKVTYCFDPYSRFDKVVRSYTWMATWDAVDKRWLNLDDMAFWESGRREEITHWMPLPEPPEED